ncbi:hypothetical protein [Virgibacillus saliphilus]|nr:hypothetical protein [Virgibacillus sp. NKC19-3]
MGELLFTLFYGSALIFIGVFSKHMINKLNYKSESAYEEKDIAE